MLNPSLPRYIPIQCPFIYDFINWNQAGKISMFHRKITVPLIKTRFSTMVNGKITIVHGQTTCLNHFSYVSWSKTLMTYIFSWDFHIISSQSHQARPTSPAARRSKIWEVPACCAWSQSSNSSRPRKAGQQRIFFALYWWDLMIFQGKTTI